MSKTFELRAEITELAGEDKWFVADKLQGALDRTDTDLIVIDEMRGGLYIAEETS